MIWLWFALAAAATGAAFTLVQKHFVHTSDHVDDLHTAQAFQIACALFFAVIALIGGVSLVVRFPLSNLLILSLSYGLGSLTMFAAIKRLPASVATILLATNVVWVAILSWIFLGESITLLKLCALVAISAAVLLVTYKPEKGKRFDLSSGVLYALVSGFCFGAGIVNDAAILQSHNLDVRSFLVAGFLFPGLFLILVGGKRTLGLGRVLRRRDFQKNLLITTLAYSLSALFFYLAIQRGPVVPIGIVNQTQVAMIAAGGILFFHERERLKQRIFGLLCAVIGVILAGLS